MDKYEQKYRIIEKIMQSEDEVLLNKIDSLLNISRYDFWSKLPVEVKRDINNAKTELDEGKGIPHKQVMSEIKERYLKQ